MDIRISEVFRRILPVAIIVSVTVGFLALMYWEFVYDVNVDKELQFFTSIQPVPDAENALYSLVAINAPLGTDNIREWGKRELASASKRPRVGAYARIKSTSEPNSESKIYVEMRDETQHYVCWLPGLDREGSEKNCMDEATIRDVIQRNRVVMQRYQTAFKYQSLYYELHDKISFSDTINLTKLAVIDYWLRRDELSQNDIAEIFEMMLFWERVIREGNHSFVGMAIALVNYGLASSLVTRLSELDPGILTDYYQAYGKFFDKPFDAGDFETIVKHEFRMMNAEFCFVTRYGDQAVDCQPKPFAFAFKPGRTIRIFYDQRLKYEDCYGPERRLSKASDDNELIFWATVFARPGNFRGRTVALLFANSQRKTCELFENLRFKVETNRFRNFYLKLKQDGLSPDQLDKLYQDDKEFFRIGDSDQFYVWDSENELLVFNLAGFEINYAIPYR